MGIKISVDGASINKPGAYSSLKTSPLTGFPLTANGIVAVIGPSDGGAPGLAGPFTGANIQRAKQVYKSGPIADSLDLLVNPSNDERIVNGASTIYIYKVNNSTRSEVTLSSWGKLVSTLYGISANQVNAKIETAQVELKPSLSFTYVAPVADVSIKVRVNGSVLTSNVSILSTDTASLAASKIDGIDGISAINNDGIITVTVNIDTPNGVGSTLEIVDGVGTNELTTIGIPANKIGSVISSAAEKKILYTIKHPDYTDEISDNLGGTIAMEIGYEGTTAEMTITNTNITTNVVGGIGTGLNINFSEYNNLKEVVDYINTQPGYSCTTNFLGALTSKATILDKVTSVGICSTASGLKPGKIKIDSYSLSNYINVNSQLVTCEETSKAGLPVDISITYLAGGTLGTATNSSFQAGFDKLKLNRINHVIPLIAKDGSEEGYGTYDWDTVSSQLLTHIKWGWSTVGKSERQGFIGKSGNKDNIIQAIKSINSGFISLFSQTVKRVNSLGNLVFLPEWSSACIVAGLKAGSDIGEPPTYKYINALGINQDNSWSPKTDYAELIDAGLTFFEEVDSGGYRVVVGNTTYGKDANFVWNRISVVEAGGYIAYDLRKTLEDKFTGVKAGARRATGSRSGIENFIKARMTDYLNADIIVADDSAALGYKNLSVIVSGNQAIINVTVYPVQGIDFILPSIYLDNAIQTA